MEPGQFEWEPAFIFVLMLGGSPFCLYDFGAWKEMEDSLTNLGKV
jgi:hypothetical protein